MPVGGVEVDRLFSESERSVRGLMRRAYRAVSVEGGGRASVAWSRVGLRSSILVYALGAAIGILTSR